MIADGNNFFALYLFPSNRITDDIFSHLFFQDSWKVFSRLLSGQNLFQDSRHLFRMSGNPPESLKKPPLNIFPAKKSGERPESNTKWGKTMRHRWKGSISKNTQKTSDMMTSEGLDLSASLTKTTSI